ncbi:hypothetical protein CK203_073052 [Vitis vinifera]|uniref:Uncharacterized protein n=1 Tax=Vitis vinifera TaxID=29760 RepID=A0A438BY17_VITVI|nr:hypothetical protein CK203_073052 [Vitis vinifera]
MCTQKEKGGLGIRKIVLLNKALLGKWIWRFAFEKDVLWKKVIGVKYGLEGCGWRSNEVRGWGGGLRLCSGRTISAVTQRCPKRFPSFMPWRRVASFAKGLQDILKGGLGVMERRRS